MAVEAMISVTLKSRAVPARPAVPGQKARLASRSVYRTSPGDRPMRS